MVGITVEGPRLRQPHRRRVHEVLPVFVTNTLGVGPAWDFARRQHQRCRSTLTANPAHGHKARRTSSCARRLAPQRRQLMVRGRLHRNRPYAGRGHALSTTCRPVPRPCAPRATATAAPSRCGRCSSGMLRRPRAPAEADLSFRSGIRTLRQRGPQLPGEGSPAGDARHAPVP